MTIRFYHIKLAGITLLPGFLVLSAAAQPTITAVSPAANQKAAVRTSPVTVRFSQPLVAGSEAALRVFSSQRGGLRTNSSGTTTLNNDQLTFAPTYDFRPGETVRVGVTTAARSSAGALATPRLFQFTAAATGGYGTFSGGSDPSVGVSPYNVTVADVDNDGDLDLLSPTFSGSSVSVRLNNGSGSFGGGSNPSVGSQPRSVTTADIDSDGDLDLLTANYNANSVSVRFNNGSGTFSGSTDYTVGSQPQSVTTADLDGDGDLDFLVANGASDNVMVRMNDGVGNFSGGSTVSVGTLPFNIQTGDVDGDGDLDLLTANWGTASTTVSIRLNNGNGTFSGGSDPILDSRPRWVALGDLDGDNDLDLMSANFGSNNASVRFNNGSGSFGGGTEYSTGTGPTSIAAADLDGDADLDMVVVNFNSNNVTVRLNNGAGSFGSSSTVSVGTNPNGVAAADIDNDGDLDFLAANFASATISVRLNQLSALPDLVVSTPQNVNGTYGNVTITGPATGGAGTATLTGGLTVVGTLTVQDGGTLLTNCQPLTGTGNFVLAAGGTLGICDAAGIEATGNVGSVQLSGSRSFSNDASYTYNGTVAQVTGGALPNQVRNLTTTNANTVTLNAAETVMQVLTVAGAGNLVLNGKSLTLPSGATGTALAVNSSTGIVQGNTALVQRYLDPSVNNGLGYRHYSSPVAATTVADLATSGFAPVLNPVYNTSPTPGSVKPFPTVYGYDQSRLATTTNSSSAFDKGWFSPAGTADALTPGRGYTVNIMASETVDFNGTLNTGDLTLPLARNTGATAADAGWAFVGNPYPAPLDWSLVNGTDRPNLDAAMYVFESSNQYQGNYRTYANGVGGSPLIGSSQGFFVRVSEGQSGGSLTFRNAQRVTSYATQVPVRRGTAETRPLVQLALQGTTGPTDALFVYAETGATSGLDSQYDAVKLLNSSGLNLAALAVGGPAQAIAGLPQFAPATVVPLSFGVPAAGSYTLRAEQLLNLPTGLDAYLIDAQTNQQINLRQQTSYSFAVTAQQAAQAQTGRFELRFGPAAGPLATSAALAAADVVLYPNPAHATFSVQVPKMTADTPAKASLFNSLGQQVRGNIQLSASGAATTVDVADLAKGVYTLRIQLGTASIAKRLVVE
ncbi:VCBS repeat-containing protein [Microvirga sp. STS02]|uniref:FG-GAP-like repeat-containing protein n=1 Tax=Hymenobacter negativus TaxID=2795026 RepID=UPI0018DD1C4A|nr:MULTISPECIES: FG-GAP-like repeat-containing protein [Bacteria]MBH8571240.1 VCBS repeat-containing protein [Hymenobacter negativus]MBR7210977.1 VCBS repeat-containing protein [Microvirga sp. STS02]